MGKMFVNPNTPVRVYVDEKNRFVEKFNPTNGFYMRTGEIDNGVDTGVDPFMRDFPGLLDIGIMGHCTHAHLCTVGCYQGGKDNNKPNMPLEDYKAIIDQCKDKLFQVALGGHGDPNKHESFAEILRYTREKGIVPNYTTSGFNLTDEEVATTKEYCGAVAVSWYRRDYTLDAIRRFTEAGVKTNIHYVLGNDSIEEAIHYLRAGHYRYMADHPEPGVVVPDIYLKSLPERINAVIFLLHKPVGCGRAENVLSPADPKVARFFELIDNGKFPFKVGFDSCTVPGLVNFTTNVMRDSFDTCEGGRYSAYVTPDSWILPCSFDNQWQRWAVNLKEHTIQEAWDSELFLDFRDALFFSCPECPSARECGGGCPIIREIVLCERPEKKQLTVCGKEGER